MLLKSLENVDVSTPSSSSIRPMSHLAFPQSVGASINFDFEDAPPPYESLLQRDAGLPVNTSLPSVQPDRRHSHGVPPTLARTTPDVSFNRTRADGAAATDPLPLPFCLPQAKGKSIARGYNPILQQAAGISLQEMIKFIDGLNDVMAASPAPSSVIGKAVRQVPIPWAATPSTFSQTVSQVRTSIVSEPLTENYLRAANLHLFQPRGLDVRVCTTHALTRLLNNPSGSHTLRKPTISETMANLSQSISLVLLQLPFTDSIVRGIADRPPRTVMTPATPSAASSLGAAMVADEEKELVARRLKMVEGKALDVDLNVPPPLPQRRSREMGERIHDVRNGDNDGKARGVWQMNDVRAALRNVEGHEQQKRPPQGALHRRGYYTANDNVGGHFAAGCSKVPAAMWDINEQRRSLKKAVKQKKREVEEEIKLRKRELEKEIKMRKRDVKETVKEKRKEVKRAVKDGKRELKRAIKRTKREIKSHQRHIKVECRNNATLNGRINRMAVNAALMEHWSNEKILWLVVMNLEKADREFKEVDIAEMAKSKEVMDNKVSPWNMRQGGRRPVFDRRCC